MAWVFWLFQVKKRPHDGFNLFLQLGNALGECETL